MTRAVHAQAFVNMSVHVQVKDYLNASATVCDVSGLCSTSTFFVIVTPNVTAGLQPVITGLNFAVSCRDNDAGPMRISFDCRLLSYRSRPPQVAMQALLSLVNTSSLVPM